MLSISNGFFVLFFTTCPSFPRQNIHTNCHLSNAWWLYTYMCVRVSFSLISPLLSFFLLLVMPLLLFFPFLAFSSKKRCNYSCSSRRWWLCRLCCWRCFFFCFLRIFFLSKILLALKTYLYVEIWREVENAKAILFNCRRICCILILTLPPPWWRHNDSSTTASPSACICRSAWGNHSCNLSCRPEKKVKTLESGRRNDTQSKTYMYVYIYYIWDCCYCRVGP